MSKVMNAMLMLVILASLVLSSSAALFHPNNGSLCINSNYTLNYSLSRPVQGDVECAGICDDMQRCQAFTTDDGLCQLFMFDKCSKYVRNCNCTRRGQVFVKQQPRLGPGALCPSDFTDNLCGVKYKWTSSLSNWGLNRQACAAEAGLTIMADAIDVPEVTHLKAVFTRDGPEEWIRLGGYQLAGSNEPLGGWLWFGCNTSIARNLWNRNPDEPNNQANGENENVVALRNNQPLLHDVPEAWLTLKSLCECLSPFD